MKTIEEAIQAASQCLDNVGIENPRIESEFLIAACLKVPRTHLVLHREQRLTADKIKAVQSWIKERQKRKPLAYVSGEQPFRDLRLKVSPAVLIPRPETELLVEQAYRLLDRIHQPAIAIDVGSGSGAIALSLSAHPHVAQVIGIDISKEALRIARSNGKENQRAPVEWLEGDLLSPLLKRHACADLVVANLPYVRSSDMRTLEPELHWEPPIALDGGEDGLRFIEPCAQQALEVLRGGGFLLLEIGAEQEKLVRDLLVRQGGWADIQIFRDFAGLPRIAQASRKVL
jgi:release factor glutamine methyltransferase